MVARDKQAQAGTWAWGARRTSEAPWRAERDALTRLAAQHGPHNRYLFGQRSNALGYLAVGHA
jgi:hypothetical protein